MLKKDLTNKQFGRLTVQYIHSRTRNGHIRWHCICECGAEKDILATHLLSGKIVSCGKHVKRSKERKDWKGYEGISGQFWSQIKRNADGSKGSKVLPFNLTIQEIWELYQKQDGKCALSGLQIYPPRKWDDPATASLDRIDSSKGYISGNVQWVHKDINRLKGVFDQSYFLELCRKVYEYHEKMY